VISVTILYPRAPSARFDMNYYLHRHMPMSMELLGSHSGFRGLFVQQGIHGPDPASAPAFFAITQFLFTSVEAFVDAFLPHAALLQDDIKRYTDVEPQIAFGESMLDLRRAEPGAGNPI